MYIFVVSQPNNCRQYYYKFWLYIYIYIYIFQKTIYNNLKNE